MLFRQFLLSLSVILFISACSNDDDDDNRDGNSVFLHLVTDAAQVRIEGNDRNYGTLRFEQFSSSVALTEGGYTVDLVEIDQQNLANNETIARDVKFNVRPDRNKFQVIYGAIAQNNAQIASLEMARDDDFADEDNDENIYFNVTHLYTGANRPDVDIYLARDGADAAEATLQASLSFAETSDEIVIDESSQELIVVLAGTSPSDSANIVYRSGREVIYDAREQAIVLAESVGLESNTIAAYYYAVGFSPEIWRNQLDGKTGLVKFVNALVDVEDDITSYLDSVTVSALSDSASATDVAYGSSSEYQEIATGNYRLSFDAGVSTSWSDNLRIGAGVAQTVYFFGDVDQSGPLTAPLKSTDDFRQLSNYASLQLVHLVPGDSDEDAPVVDLHLTKDGFLDASTLIASGLQFGGSVTFYVRNPSQDDTYSLAITRNGQVSTALFTLALDGDASLKSGLSQQFAAIKNSASGAAELVNVSVALP